ncbi:putative RutC family protein [Blattamonas nauphoetae]|uniref:RutC family protein n=1 Tax=Blattamonas nauphoetae TaxID=2049346 RepID=A0ABQ9XXJ4_9EUKA|nr:putative RutC family protein [Blattamonas nauphoetae]
MSQVIFTENAPLPIGPYSQGRRAGDLVYLSGQIPVDPKTKALVPGGIEEQTQQVLKNIQALLDELKVGSEKIVKTLILLKDIGDFGKMNAVYATFFKDVTPARSCFAVKDLPMGSLVEIEFQYEDERTKQIQKFKVEARKEWTVHQVKKAISYKMKVPTNMLLINKPPLPLSPKDERSKPISELTVNLRKIEVLRLSSKGTGRKDEEGEIIDEDSVQPIQKEKIKVKNTSTLFNNVLIKRIVGDEFSLPQYSLFFNFLQTISKLRNANELFASFLRSFSLPNILHFNSSEFTQCLWLSIQIQRPILLIPFIGSSENIPGSRHFPAFSTFFKSFFSNEQVSDYISTNLHLCGVFIPESQSVPEGIEDIVNSERLFIVGLAANELIVYGSINLAEFNEHVVEETLSYIIRACDVYQGEVKNSTKAQLEYFRFLESSTKKGLFQSQNLQQ